MSVTTPSGTVCWRLCSTEVRVGIGLELSQSHVNSLLIDITIILAFLGKEFHILIDSPLELCGS